LCCSSTLLSSTFTCTPLAKLQPHLGEPDKFDSTQHHMQQADIDGNHQSVPARSSFVTVAGICNSVGGGVLFDIQPRCRCRWRISVHYAPCIAGRSSVPLPSPHASSQLTRQLPPPLLIIRCLHDAIVAAMGCVIDCRDDRLVQQCISRLITLVVPGTNYPAATCYRLKPWAQCPT